MALGKFGEQQTVRRWGTVGGKKKTPASKNKKAKGKKNGARSFQEDLRSVWRRSSSRLRGDLGTKTAAPNVRNARST